MLISLVEYAEMQGKDQSRARRKAINGDFKTAKKVGRNWVIDSEEPWVDFREVEVVNSDYLSTTYKIFHLLKKQRKTQLQLAEFLGLNRQIISQWKTGKNSSYKKYITEIAKFLGVSTDDLL